MIYRKVQDSTGLGLSYFPGKCGKDVEGKCPVYITLPMPIMFTNIYYYVRLNDFAAGADPGIYKGGGPIF